MPHRIESATSGRAKCRGCRRTIARGELRFGEALPNPFAEGEATFWYHPRCAAYKRPEPLLATLEQTQQALDDREGLLEAARRGLARPRLPRIDGAERAASGRASCRSCREPIARGEWRLRLVFVEEGRFSPGGFVHLRCRRDYFETDDIAERVLHFSPALTADEAAELRRELARDDPAT